MAGWLGSGPGGATPAGRLRPTKSSRATKSSLVTKSLVSPLAGAAALLAGTALGSAPAQACYNGPYPATITGATSCVIVNNTSFTGNVVNAGTITSPGPPGILVTASTVTGQVVNAAGGSIVAASGGVRGIAIDPDALVTNGIVNAGSINVSSSGIAVAGTSSFGGGISNGGLISVDFARGINLDSVATFSGGISNSGTITGRGSVVSVAFFTTFQGGISNSGAISGRTGIVALIGSSFAGGISNSGSITAGRTGVYAYNISAFAGGISNSGSISAGRFGIKVGTAASCTPVCSSTFAGGIRNSGTITAVAGIVAFGVSTFLGGIGNSGTITAGSTGISVGGVSAFLGGISNSGTISAGGHGGIRVGFTSTFFGGISNSGTITARSVGIFLDGLTTFQGGIGNSGTISADSTGISVGDVSTFQGGIGNSGTITAGAASTGIRVSGASTFQGGISNAGTITAGASGAGISVGGVSAFLGGISNSGMIAGPTGIRIGSGVTFAGGAAIVNSGTITGTGGTAINTSGATSAVTIDQTGGLISGAIRLSAHANGLNISGGTIAGNVVGLGTSDTVNFALGSGTFTYASPFAMTGLSQANINSGTVLVDGSIQATTIAANNGGTAAGTGTLAGAVTVASGGTLMPGQPLGTLTVAGSLTFNPGSFYSVHITDTTSSSTLVNGAPGTAIINGGTVLVTAPFATLGAHGGTTYTILTATSRTGTFAGLIVNGNNNNSNVNFTGAMALDYSIANEVLLDVGRGFTVLSLPSGANGNQQNVLSGINNAILNNDTLSPAFQNLANLSAPSLLSALSQLSGEVGASFSQGAFQAGNSFLNLMLNPFVDNRGGNGGFAPTGFAAEESPALPQAAAVFANVVKAPPRDATLGSTQRFQAWGAAYGGAGTVSGDPAAGSHNTSSQVYGFGGGFDYRVSPDTILGLALAGGATHWSLDQGFGSGRSDMFQAGLYGSTHWGAAYLSGALAYAFHDVTTNRTVTVAGTDALQANFRANVLSERIEGGYRVASPWLAMTPYAAVQVQSLFLPAYGEGATSGSAQFALSYQSQSTTTTRTELGARLDKSWLLDPGALVTFYGRAAWAHDFNNTATATALFQTLPGSNFVVNGARPAPDGALLTAGAQYRLASGWSLQAKFDGELSTTTSIYSGTGIIRKEW